MTNPSIKSAFEQFWTHTLYKIKEAKDANSADLEAFQNEVNTQMDSKAPAEYATENDILSLF